MLFASIAETMVASSKWNLGGGNAFTNRVADDFEIATTMSISCVDRGSPCTLEAIDPVIMYWMPLPTRT